MKQLIISHPDLGTIRSIKVNGEFLFVAKDVCDILGYRNARKAIADHCDEGDVTKRYTPTESGDQEVNYLTESGVYSLIFGSRLPIALDFKKWVTSEVLPSIRKQGFYVHPSARLTRTEEKRIERTMRESMSRYITAEDVFKCARKFRTNEDMVRGVLGGYRVSNEIMADLQARAITNQATHVNAYGVDRMKDVLTKLTK